MLILDAEHSNSQTFPLAAFARSAGTRLQGQALACLEGEAGAGRFFAWAGQSGRRYTCTVFPIDREDPARGLPDLGPAVLIAVSRQGSVCRKLGIRSVERASDWSRAVLDMSRGADEWHVHLLAQDRAARAVALADLDGNGRLAVVA